MLLTLDEILGRADGDKAVLRYRFLHLQRIGLLGNAVGKEARKGGAGVWRPVQATLFRLYLEQLSRGVRRSTLANIPVGLWLLANPGIELRQAQRALGFWSGRVTAGDQPADRRSLRRRGVSALVEQLAAPSTGRPTRRRLRNAVEAALDQLPDVSVASMDALRAAIQAAAPAGQADTAYAALRLRLMAVGHLPLIVSGRRGVAETWEWCRALVAGTNTAAGRTPSLSQPSEQAERIEFLNAACGLVLQLWGIALEGQSGRWSAEGQRPPPQLDLASGGG